MVPQGIKRRRTESPAPGRAFDGARGLPGGRPSAVATCDACDAEGAAATGFALAGERAARQNRETVSGSVLHRAITQAERVHSLNVAARWRLTTLTILGACCLTGPTGLAGQQSVEAYSSLVGAWEGQLECLDYGDNRTRVRLPTSLHCRIIRDGTALEFQFSYVEPSGRVETSTDLLTVSHAGLSFGDLWQVKEQTLQGPAGVFRLILEREGVDNGQAAVIVNAIVLENDSLTMTSTVTYEASGESLQRNRYQFRRTSG